ncbi:hypothetical protein PVAG01_09403 [Phlyctema vagabunda]|uniref:Uncharacterized protein n=1 Tax=Phlyctema vagabunda TaxID=108571 RepID=A0ABR4P7X7_9HELO
MVSILVAALILGFNIAKASPRPQYGYGGYGSTETTTIYSTVQNYQPTTVLTTYTEITYPSTVYETITVSVPYTEIVNYPTTIYSTETISIPYTEVVSVSYPVTVYETVTSSSAYTITESVSFTVTTAIEETSIVYSCSTAESATSPVSSPPPPTTETPPTTASTYTPPPPPPTSVYIPPPPPVYTPPPYYKHAKDRDLPMERGQTAAQYVKENLGAHNVVQVSN